MGFRFKVSGSRFQVQGFRFKVSGSRFQVQGFRFKVSGSKQPTLNLGTWNLEPKTCCRHVAWWERV
jgi:hypothetical protein